MLGVLLFLALLFLIGRFDLPESPLWLIRQGRIKECNKMIKLFGEPVVFEAEDAKTTRFIELFNKRHFSFVLCCRNLDLPSDPDVCHLYLWPQIVGLLGWDTGRSAALGNVVISLFLCWVVFLRCFG